MVSQTRTAVKSISKQRDIPSRGILAIRRSSPQRRRPLECSVSQSFGLRCSQGRTARDRWSRVRAASGIPPQTALRPRVLRRGFRCLCTDAGGQLPARRASLGAWSCGWPSAAARRSPRVEGPARPRCMRGPLGAWASQATSSSISSTSTSGGTGRLSSMRHST